MKQNLEGDKIMLDPFTTPDIMSTRIGLAIKIILALIFGYIFVFNVTKDEK